MPTQAMRRIHIIYPDFHSLYFHARLSPADITFVLQSSGFTHGTPYGLIDCLFGTLVGVHALMYRVTLGLCPVVHRTSEFFFHLCYQISTRCKTIYCKNYTRRACTMGLIPSGTIQVSDFSLYTSHLFLSILLTTFFLFYIGYFLTGNSNASFVYCRY